MTIASDEPFEKSILAIGLASSAPWFPDRARAGSRVNNPPYSRGTPLPSRRGSVDELGRREGRVHRGERVWVARTQPHPNVLVGAEGFGPPVALTGWLEADQAELTVLHRPEDERALRATGYCFSSLAGRPGAHGRLRVRARLKALGLY